MKLAEFGKKETHDLSIVGIMAPIEKGALCHIDHAGRGAPACAPELLLTRRVKSPFQCVPA